MKNALITGLMMACVGLANADTRQACTSPTPPLNDVAIQKFAESAAIQSFTYDFKTLPTHLSALENCYTHTGWQSFSLALQRSGNVDTAKQLKLYAKAQRIGPIRTLTKESATDTWRVLIPIRVVYSNHEQTMTQNLDVKLLLNLENNKIGVEQITASPSLPIAKNGETPSSQAVLGNREDTQHPASSPTQNNLNQMSYRDTEVSESSTVERERIQTNNQTESDTKIRQTQSTDHRATDTPSHPAMTQTKSKEAHPSSSKSAPHSPLSQNTQSIHEESLTKLENDIIEKAPITFEQPTRPKTQQTS